MPGGGKLVHGDSDSSVRRLLYDNELMPGGGKLVHGDSDSSATGCDSSVQKNRSFYPHD